MILGVVADILLAVFAVFGFYAALRLLIAFFASPANLSVALEIRSAEDAKNIDCLLSAARENFYLRRGDALVVLLDNALSEDAELMEKLKKRNATIHFVKKGSAGDAGGCEKRAGDAER